LSLVRSLNREHAEMIVRERASRGRFADFHDFCKAVPLPAHTLLKLALAGAFSCFGFERRHALWMALSAGYEPSALLRSAPLPPPSHEIVPLSMPETLMADLDSTQVYLTLHPFELVGPHMNERPGYVSSSRLQSVPNGSRVLVAGLPIIRQRPPTAGGLLFMTLEDHEGFFNLVVPAQVLNRYRRALLEEPLLMAVGRVERADSVTNVKVSSVQGIRLDIDPRHVQSRDFH